MSWILILFRLFTWMLLRPTLSTVWPMITVNDFSADSDANKIVQYRYDNSSWDMDMISTFKCENGWFDIKTISKSNDYWLCQLHYDFNKEVINDKMWLSGWQFQAKVCLDKWKNARSKYIRNCYKIRKYYKDDFTITDWLWKKLY